MLETMRNQAQSWIAKLILGGVALSFVLWGIGDYFNSAQVQTVAEVDGAPITDGEFRVAYERQLNSYRALLGKQFSKDAVAALGLKQNTVQTLVNRHLILSEAADMGLVAPKDALIDSVRRNPAFQSAGNFDEQRYKVLTRNMGFRTPTDYEASLRMDLIANAMQQGLIQSATVSEEDIRQRYAREYETREIEALIVDPSAIEKKIKISDKQARDYFAAHKDTYRSPLKLTMNVVFIDPQKLAADIAIDDAEIKAAYEEHQDRYLQPETRRVRHILARLPENANDDMRKAARAKIEKARKQVKAGKSFAEVAKRMSDDKVTAKNGGDIGYLPRGSTVSAFDAAMFSLAKGEISDVVETQFGLHILQVEDIKAERLKPLQEVRDDLHKELALAKADEETYRLSQDLDDALGREDTLKAAADSINLSSKIYGPIGIAEARAYPIFGNAAFRTALFSKQPGDTVDVVEQNKGRFVAVEVLKRIEPANLPFEKATKQVYDDARRAAAREQARQLAEKLLKQTAGNTFASLAQQHGLPLYLSKPVRSNGSGDSNADWLSPQSLLAAFNLSEGAVVNRVLQAPKGFAIVKVKRIIKADAGEFNKQRAAIRGELLKARGAVRFARWMAATRDRHDILIHDKVVERF
ncbi:MAG: SurA N-terminal domain-containing protein [Mariprofundaceae bacterium]|nr:SurA N-terminal domain-containing protein [Mariprofundaceae bacterium]